ncbi:hypothetical protein V7V80_06490 [Pseudomonas kermanshahensis]|uniref:DUF2188 domain-containing protein n=1 Tax=Pseudomonas kermanshahensis TaxID=2745482 RepID=A0ABU8R3A7_9PSED
MNVYVEEIPEQHRWWVHMDDWRVSFTSPREAEEFVQRLSTRLNAPHPLNMIAGWQPRAGLTEGDTPLGSPNNAERRCAREA